MSEDSVDLFNRRRSKAQKRAGRIKRTFRWFARPFTNFIAREVRRQLDRIHTDPLVIAATKQMRLPNDRIDIRLRAYVKLNCDCQSHGTFQLGKDIELDYSRELDDKKDEMGVKTFTMECPKCSKKYQLTHSEDFIISE